MLQACQQLPLAHEARGQRRVARPDALDRHVLLERAIHAAGTEDFAHAALADAFQHLVGADAQVERRFMQVGVRHPRQQRERPCAQRGFDAGQRAFARLGIADVQQFAEQVQGALFEGGVWRGHARIIDGARDTRCRATA